MDIFRPSARERYRLDSIQVEQVVQITAQQAGEVDAANNYHPLRLHIHSYARNHGKRFATRAVNGVLHVKRLK